METDIDHIINAGRRQQRPNWTFLSLIGVGVLIVGAIFGSAATTRGWFNGGAPTKVPIYVSSDTKVNEQITMNGGFSAIAKAVTPAVVTVTVSTRRSQQQTPSLLDPFREFFPDQDDERPRRRATPRQPQGPGRMMPSGVGSGIIISPDGYIVTNNHVVEDADKVEIELNDNRKFTAKIVGADDPSDVAVLKIDATGLPTVPFGDSDKVEVGDLVLAIGNPLGIGQTVTMGIISAKSRQSPGRGDNKTYEDFLQTDAAINRGNSGGALVNLRGELIGVPSQILSQSGGNIGIGFAIPTKMARNVMDQLIRNGKVRRGKLGIYVRDVDPDLAKEFGYKGVSGAFVDDTEKGAPAEQAGVKPGDIITEFQGQRINDGSQLRNAASQTAPGTTVRFKVWRDGAERELTAKLTEVEAKEASKPASVEPTTSSLGLLSGVRVENISQEWAQRLNLSPSARGVVVVDVDPDSNAAAAGLRPGYLIESVAKQPVANVNEFNAAMQKADKTQVLLRVRRSDGRSFFLNVKPQE
jgi:Do/DeqQ family serine protease